MNARLHRGPLLLNGVGSLESHVGQELGPSNWHRVTQRDVDNFGALSGDEHWIHLDPERAAKSEFGGTLVHGFFTLALVPRLFNQIVEIHGFEHGLNYGLDRIRFPAPLPTGVRIRLRAVLEQVDPVGDCGVQCVFSISIEREEEPKPVCIASWISRYDGRAPSF